MGESSRYQVSNPNIIHELIDDEVVIVDLEKGYYYSLRGVGAEVWTGLVDGMSEDEIVQGLVTSYDVERAEVEKTVSSLVLELQEENMIVPAASGGQRERSAEEARVSLEPKSRKFEPPILEKYTDMAELLLLDPIHEVDETGWPKVAPDNFEGQK